MRDATPAATTPLKQRLGAVWLTYRTRPMIWLAGGVIATVLSLFLITLVARAIEGSHESQRVLTGLGLMLGVASITAAAGLGLQGKSQFVTPQARLLPGYRPAHLRVLRNTALAMLVAYPLLVAFSLSLAPIGATALALLAGAGILWTWHDPRIVFFTLPLLLSLNHPLVLAFWLDARSSGWALHTPLAALGGWAVWRWLRRLDRLTEEDRDYSIPPISTGFSRPSRSERAEQRKVAAKQFGRGTSWIDRRLDRRLSRGVLPYNALVRLALQPTPAWFNALMGGGALCGSSLLMTFLLSGNNSPPITLFMLPVSMLICMPGLAASQTIHAKRPLLETELLRPTSRREYYASLIRAMLSNAAVFAVVLAGMTLALIAVFSPDVLTPERVGSYMAYCLGANLLFIATQLGIAARHSTLFCAVVQTVLTMAIMMAGMLINRPGVGASFSVYASTVAGGLMLVLSAPLFRWAYGRWLTAEAA